MEEDKGYEVVDKREVTPKEEEQPKPETEAKAEPAAGDQESPEEEEQEAAGAMPTGDVYSLITLSVMMLTESAWQWMGLRMNPATGKVQKDMNQARIAIDSIVFLIDKIAPHINEDDRRAFRAMINDLQVNFVQQASRE